jgi:hypothetical protein
MLRDETFGRVERPEAELVRFRAMLDELRRDEQSIGLAAVTVAVRELTALADGLAARSTRGRS